MADFKMRSGVDYLPRYSWDMGMNDDLAYFDRAGWNTSTEMLTGGQTVDWCDMSSLEVAPDGYEMDPMGQERSRMTFVDSSPDAKGMIGMSGAEGGAGMQDNASYATLSGPGGKRIALAPQNYSNVGSMKKA